MKKIKQSIIALFLFGSAFYTYNANADKLGCTICTGSIEDAWCFQQSSPSVCQVLIQEGEADCNRYETEFGCPPTVQ